MDNVQKKDSLFLDGFPNVLKVRRKRLTQLINELISNGGVCRTAPGTPGLGVRVRVRPRW